MALCHRCAIEAPQKFCSAILDFWLGAARSLGWEKIAADVRQGTKRDAVLYSVGANGVHGHRRTNEDKRRAVMTMLTDDEWGKMSDNDIAKHCGVSHPFVGSVRRDTCNGYKYENQTRTFIHPKTGQPTVMNTTNIGGGTIVRADPHSPGSWTPADVPALDSSLPEPPAGFLDDDEVEDAADDDTSPSYDKSRKRLI